MNIEQVRPTVLHSLLESSLVHWGHSAEGGAADYTERALSVFDLYVDKKLPVLRISLSEDDLAYPRLLRAVFTNTYSIAYLYTNPEVTELQRFAGIARELDLLTDLHYDYVMQETYFGGAPFTLFLCAKNARALRVCNRDAFLPLVSKKRTFF